MFRNSATVRALDYIKGSLRTSTEEDHEEILLERIPAWVDGELMREEIRDVCADLVREHGKGIDTGVLHKWGGERDLESDLDAFASSLAVALLQAAASKMIREGF